MLNSTKILPAEAAIRRAERRTGEIKVIGVFGTRGNKHKNNVKENHNRVRKVYFFSKDIMHKPIQTYTVSQHYLIKMQRDFLCSVDRASRYNLCKYPT
jgi:hypothetical protein